MSTLKVTNIEPQSGTDVHITGSLIVSNIVRAREVVTTISSSQVLVSGSTRFGDSSDDTHLFTGSIAVSNGITGSTEFTTIVNKPTLLSSSAQIASDISGSFTAPSASISTRLTTAETELSNTLLSSSAQIAADISGSSTSLSSSLAGRITTAEDELGNTLISGAAQISTEISGSFTEASASFSTRVAANEAFSSSLDATYATDAQVLAQTASLSSSLATDIATRAVSSSFATDIATNVTNIATNVTDITTLTAATGSFALSANNATTGSNTFKDNQIVSSSVLLTLQQVTGSAPATPATGSLIVSGSPVQLYIFNGSGSGWNRV